jgi:hypothetical protein
VTVTTEPYDPIVVTSVGPLAFGDDSYVCGEPVPQGTTPATVTTECKILDDVGIPVGSAVTLPYTWNGSLTSVAVPVVETCSMSVQLTAP